MLQIRLTNRLDVFEEVYARPQNGNAFQDCTARCPGFPDPVFTQSTKADRKDCKVETVSHSKPCHSSHTAVRAGSPAAPAPTAAAAASHTSYMADQTHSATEYLKLIKMQKMN